MTPVKHRFHHADAAARKAFEMAGSRGWTVLVFGRGFWFSVLQHYFRRAECLYAREHVLICKEGPTLSFRFVGGGEIKFIDYTPGKERGQELLEKNETADLIFVVEDQVGSMISVLKEVIYPIMERSGDHCSLNMLGDQNDSNPGEY